MRGTLRLLLTIVAVLTALLSVLSLFWWSIGAYSTLFMSSGVPLSPSFVPPGSRQVLVYQAVKYFFIFGGLFGWIALFALCSAANRHLSQVPKWVLVGCAVGTFAALAMPSGYIYAYFPIICAASLLLRCWLAVPNCSSKRTREKPRAA